MKKLTPLLFAAALSGCAVLQAPLAEPNVNLVDLRLLDASLFEQRYTLTLRVQNPNAVDLPIAGVNLRLDINDTELGHGVSNRAVTVPAYGDALMEINIVSNLVRILDQVRGLESGTVSGLRYRLSGDLRVANRFGKLPFDYHGELARRR